MTTSKSEGTSSFTTATAGMRRREKLVLAIQAMEHAESQYSRRVTITTDWRDGGTEWAAKIFDMDAGVISPENVDPKQLEVFQKAQDRAQMILARDVPGIDDPWVAAALVRELLRVRDALSQKRDLLEGADQVFAE